MGLNIYILTYKQKEKYSGMEWLKGKLVFLYIGFKQWEWFSNKWNRMGLGFLSTAKRKEPKEKYRSETSFFA